KRLAEREQGEEQKPIGLARGGQKQPGLHRSAHYAARMLAAQPSAHGNEPGTPVSTLPRDESAQTTPPIPANRVVLLTGTARAFHLFRRDALGYDGAGGRSAPRGGGPLAVERSCVAIVLAAGEGTRMRSTRPKVLHAIAGQSLLAHVLDAVRKAGGTMTAVVVGLGADAVAAEAKRVLPDAEI